MADRTVWDRDLAGPGTETTWDGGGTLWDRGLSAARAFRRTAVSLARRVARSVARPIARSRRPR